MNRYSDEYIEALITESEIIQFLEIIEEYNQGRSQGLLLEFPDLGNYFSKMGLEFLGDMGSGFKNAITEFFIDTFFTNVLGFTPQTFIGKFILEVLKEFLENVVFLNPQNIGKYFDEEEGCKYIAQDLVTVLGESGADIMLRSLIEHMQTPEFQQGIADEATSDIEREIVAKLLGAIDNKFIQAASAVLKEAFESQILERLSEYLEKVICESDLSIGEMIKQHFGFSGDSESKDAAEEV